MADVNAPSGHTPIMAPPGIVTRTNIDYAERIWEEFTQSIHTFIKDKRNLSRHTSRKKRATLIMIPSIRFTKLIIHHLQRKHRFHLRPDSPLHLSNEEPVLRYLKFSAKGTKSEVFGMPIPDSLITTEIQQATYYWEYLAKVTHHRKYLAGETGGVQNPPAPKPTQPTRKPKAPTRPSISIPVASTQPAPTSAPAKSQENKRKQATETTDKPAKAKRIKHIISHEDADYRKALEESMKDAYALPKGTLPPVVIREPCWELLKRLRFVPTDRVIQFLLMALCVPAGSSSCDSAGHIEAVPAGYDIVPAGHVLVFADRYRIC
nr:histone deacetylase 14 [Tanacetum cinerariifolium]